MEETKWVMIYYIKNTQENLKYSIWIYKMVYSQTSIRNVSLAELGGAKKKFSMKFFWSSQKFVN